jgi:hypothetical protein
MPELPVGANVSWTEHKRELRSWFKQRYWWTRLFPLILLTKDNWFAGLLTNTVGLGVGRKTFKLHYATTVGPIVLFPRAWDVERCKDVGCHEIGGHTLQCFACGVFLPLIGPFLGLVLMGLLYGLLLPVGFNWFRYRFELHADVQKWKYMIEQRRAAWVLARAKTFGATVGSKAYLWPVPRAWAVWGFERKARKVLLR